MKIKTQTSMAIKFNDEEYKALKLTNQIIKNIQYLLHNDNNLLNPLTGKVIVFEDLAITRGIISGLIDTIQWDID